MTAQDSDAGSSTIQERLRAYFADVATRMEYEAPGSDTFMDRPRLGWLTRSRCRRSPVTRRSTTWWRKTS